MWFRIVSKQGLAQDYIMESCTAATTFVRIGQLPLGGEKVYWIEKQLQENKQRLKLIKSVEYNSIDQSSYLEKKM